MLTIWRHKFNPFVINESNDGLTSHRSTRMDFDCPAFVEDNQNNICRVVREESLMNKLMYRFCGYDEEKEIDPFLDTVCSSGHPA